MSNRLAKHSILTLIANLSLAISNWLLLVIITKYFSAIALGEVVLALSVLSPLFLFCSFKLRTLLVVDLNTEYQVAQYYNARLLANSAALLSVPICWLLFLSDVNALVVLLIAVYKWFDAWCELSYSYMHRIQHFVQAAKSQVLRSVVSAIALSLGAILSNSIILPLCFWVAVTAVFAGVDLLRVSKLANQNEQHIFSLFNVIRDLSLYKTSISIFRKYFTVSLSLMFVSLFVFIPNFVLKARMGLDAAGHFAAVSYFLVAGSVLITSLSQAASPQLSRLVQQGALSQYFKLALMMCGIGFAIGLLGLLVAVNLGEWLLKTVYNDSMASLSKEFIWIMAAAMIRYSYIFLGTAMNSLKLFGFQTQIYFVGTLCVLIFCLLLVPSMGTFGAAVAMFAATCVELVLYVVRFMSIRKAHLGSLA